MHTPEDLRALSALLDEALNLAEHERDGWLDTLQGDAARLAPTLRRLLERAAAGETADLLGRSPAFTAAGEPSGGDFAPGDAIGPYRLLRALGSGGMGEVWLAERRDGQLKREVALKLPMLATRRSVLVQRFARERDIVASLAHPNIARLYDAGIADDGQPYLALEYVEGRPITEHCDAHRLPVRERLQLLRQVMQAVQYAHAHLVIHRDIKPGNVLVAADGRAMLLDFGIAKLLDDERAEAGATELTQQGGRALTLDYAAPEQVVGASVSIATDVHALGVLLYELIAGQRPFHGARHAVEQAIVGRDPLAPSQAGGGAIAALARSRAAELDTIVLKALQKSPAQRYATVEAFADDLQRWLDGAAIVARGDSRWYRARKLVLRNRLAFGAGATVLVTLVSVLSVALWQAREARREAARAQAVQQFVLDLFRANSAEQPDPLKARQTTARQLLDIGAAKVDSALADQPESRLALLDTLSGIYAELGLYAEAAALSERRLTLARRLYGADDRRLADVLVTHVQLADAGGRSSLTPLRALLNEAERILDARSDGTSPLRAALHAVAAEVLTDDALAEARRHAERAVAIHRAHQPDAPVYAIALEILSKVLLRQGDVEAARVAIDEALVVARRAKLSEYAVLRMTRRAGEVNSMAGEVEAADARMREALAASERLNGPAHPWTFAAVQALAWHLAATGRVAESRMLAARLLADSKTPHEGRERYFLQLMRRTLFGAYWLQGDLSGARRLLEEAAADRDSPIEPGSLQEAHMLMLRAMSETVAGRTAAAQPMLANVAAFIDKSGPSDFGSVLAQRSAELLLAAGDADSARRIAADELAAWPPERKGAWIVRAALQALLADALLATGRGDEARRVAQQAVDEIERSPIRRFLGASQAEIERALAQIELAQSDCAAALPHLERSTAAYREAHVPQSPWRARTDALRGICLAHAGRRDEARALLAQAEAAYAAARPLGEPFELPLRELRALIGVR